MDRRMNVIIAKLMIMFVLLCFGNDFLLTCSGADVHEEQVVFLCRDHERDALLTLKQGLMNPDDYGTNLTAWGNAKDNMDCCNWDGVTCNNKTGHVTGLELSYLRGEISPALLKLRYLDTLDLQFNDFGRRSIPEFIGSLINLEYLQLSDSNFSGHIPCQLGNLTNLRELHISYNHDLTSDNLTWLSNLTLLSYVDLSDNQLGGPISWLSYLTLLSYVDLSVNQFEGSVPDLKAFSLTQLDISHNNLTGKLPTSISQFSHLLGLDVSHNSLEGPISDAHFTQLHNLTYLDLSFNSLEGTISDVHFTELHSLTDLDLSFNSLFLNFSPNWIPPSQLQNIYLARCDMGPRFPSWLQTQNTLQNLDLFSAGISDKLPIWFSNFSHQLSYLNLSYNQISGPILDLSFVENFPAIIDIRNNNFSGPLPSFPLYTSEVWLSQNMFSGSIQSICRSTYQNLQLLDLSHNQFSGELPNCWDNMKSLAILNINDNKFSGHLPPILGSLTQLRSLQFRNNNVTGQLPPTLKNITVLNLIDGGGNGLTGNIPLWMGTLTNLSILSLRQNNFSGIIPPEICDLTLIQVLDLSENNISGEIPRCVNKFTRMIQGNDNEADYFSVRIYVGVTITHAGMYDYNTIVQWKRQDAEYKSTLKLLRLIDLSSNKLEGEIPKEIYSLTGLISLNLSQNGLTGNINSDINQLQMLDSLDLSRNRLSGKIPTGLAELHSLSVLDLSRNNLSGEIPKGTQLQSFNESSYAGNTELCGEPLLKCPQDSSPSSSNSGDAEDSDDHGDEDVTTFKSLFLEYCISAVWGYVVGFWVVVGPLLSSRSWRTAYYGYLSKIWDWLYVTITLSGRRLIRYMKSRK